VDHVSALGCQGNGWKAEPPDRVVINFMLVGVNR
jgi:hypothetical protein